MNREILWVARTKQSAKALLNPWREVRQLRDENERLAATIADPLLTGINIGNGTLSNPDPFRWFDNTAFVAPPDNTYGNVGRGVLYAPGLVGFDTSFVKNTKVTERLAVQFRLDAFNLFNTPAFGFPNANIGSPTVGRITSTIADSRDLQLALKFEF